MDTDDPIATFFPGEEDVDLYAVLSLGRDAKAEDIKKAYRRLALIHHPDKHASAATDVKINASRKFQQIGFAYSVLSDEKRRSRYDRTGRTDDVAADFGPGDSGTWETYFEELFDRATKGKLDELKEEYQNSPEELEDLKNAFNDTDGSLDEIMDHIPHSTIEDEPRFVRLITNLIKSGDLTPTSTWEKSVKDETARLKRKKKSAKEAEEAETLAKEIGVWDEFYGSGKPTDRAAKRQKGKQKANASNEDEEDISALQALILKRKKNMGEFFDDLAAKYAEPEPSSRFGGSRGKKRKAEVGEDSQTKKAKTVPPPPDIGDEEFAKIQRSLLRKTPASSKSRSSSKGEAKRKTKR
ncbi:hypothetical protein BJ322DRAFT_998052 [Thelephora terrestris]|uniref:J domain-containing protein n=1 Tax=Thelephora terrestris TaxID=56493 RepID=A0A9P6LCF3_9AGAM|nr:hypothetical protein BJ322DRAFT_998052 [Thelephora terrestris]